MVNSCLMEPLSSAFALSLFWKRTTESGVFYGLLISHAVGIVRLVIEFMFPIPPCGMPETRPAFLYRVHFMNFGAILVLFSGIVIVILSLLTKPRTEEQMENVTYWTRMKCLPSKPLTRETEMADKFEEQDNFSNNRNDSEDNQLSDSVDIDNSTEETPSNVCRDRLLVVLLGTSNKQH
ncbi:sodium/glucose cotransporter 5-like, partial [Mizuhopecten yessoensis]|uniref:sodium/glucose cotransporter 5-like n=1 Tax=Mizuhopecten yessoensis TaxID=6573 RepID=UPI000B45D8C5